MVTVYCSNVLPEALTVFICFIFFINLYVCMYVLNQLGLLCLCQKKKKKSNIVQEFNSPMGSTDMLTISAMCGEKKVFQKFS